MTLTDQLIAEHRTVERVLTAIEEELLGMQHLEEMKLAAKILERVLGPHAKLEEWVLLPALKQILVEHGDLSHMEDTHQELDGTLARLQGCQDLRDTRRMLVELTAAIRTHFAYEESKVFPLANQELESQSLEELSGAKTD